MDCCVSASRAIISRRGTFCSKTKFNPLKCSKMCNSLKRVDVASFHLVQVANKSNALGELWIQSPITQGKYFIVIYLLNFYAAHLPYKGTLGSLQVIFKHFGDLSRPSCFKGKKEKKQFQESCFLSLLWHSFSTTAPNFGFANGEF